MKKYAFILFSNTSRKSRSYSAVIPENQLSYPKICSDFNSRPKYLK